MMPFNETEYLKLLFLIADTQQWVDDLAKEMLAILPVKQIRKLRSKQYYLSITALAHIVERHYYKIPRYPNTGKFHLTLADILHYIREAEAAPAHPIPGSLTLQRVINTNLPIGFDHTGQPTTLITILTDAGGKIITAFPGMLSSACMQNIFELNHLTATDHLNENEIR